MTKTNAEEITDKLRSIIDKTELDQPKVAKIIGCSQPTVSRIYNGNRIPDYVVGKNIESLYDEKFPNGEPEEKPTDNGEGLVA